VATSSLAVTLAYEPFNYAAGAYTPGTEPASNAAGFSGSWRNVPPSGLGAFTIASGSMGYTDGNAAVLATSGNHFSAGQNRGMVDFDTSALGPFGLAGLLDGSSNIGADGTTLYMSMLLQNAAGSDGFSGALMYTDSDADTAGGIAIDLSDTNPPNTGGNHGTSTDWYLDVYFHPAGGAEPDFSDSILTGPNGNQNFYVLRIDFGVGDVDTVRAYTNPLLSGEPGTPDGILTVTGLSFDRIGLANFGGGTGAFEVDEIRVGTDYASVAVPEPSTLVLLATGLAGLLVVRRGPRR
jgi:hypothetical protein